MTGDWKTRKTEPRFPSVSHCPWKSLRDSHIPTAPADSVSEIVQTNFKKGAPESRIAHFPPSGSYFNEKMLWPLRDSSGLVEFHYWLEKLEKRKRKPQMNTDTYPCFLTVFIYVYRRLNF